MVPASGFIRSHRRESSVDLPQPDGPTIDVKLPGFISKERSLITGGLSIFIMIRIIYVIQR